MDIKYIAVDVEASGPTPANYSLLSIGASVVGQPDRTFYRELKPTSRAYVKGAMKVGSLGLRCLDDLRNHDIRYNPHSEFFRPDLVLDVLQAKGVEPKEAMSQFENWINKSSSGKKPILASDCDAFDGMFVHFYFDRFGVKNPFRYGGVNIDSMYRGFVRNPFAQIEDSEFWSGILSHNAMEDAVVQAKALEGMLLASRKTTTGTLAKKVVIYETEWCRYMEDDRIARDSEGYYHRHGDATRVLRKLKKRLRGQGKFKSGSVTPMHAIKVGRKIYKIRFGYRIPRTFADPSRLEEMTEESAELDLGGGCIVTIDTTPLVVK